MLILSNWKGTNSIGLQLLNMLHVLLAQQDPNNYFTLCHLALFIDLVAQIC